MAGGNTPGDGRLRGRLGEFMGMTGGRGRRGAEGVAGAARRGPAWLVVVVVGVPVG